MKKQQASLRDTVMLVGRPPGRPGRQWTAAGCNCLSELLETLKDAPVKVSS